MNITKTQDANKMTIALEGRLDTNTAPQLEAEFNASADGVSDLVLDLSGLVYMSSAGLRVVLAMQKKFNAVNGKMTVKNVNDIIMEVFKVTGFVDILTIE